MKRVGDVNWRHELAKRAGEDRDEATRRSDEMKRRDEAIGRSERRPLAGETTLSDADLPALPPAEPGLYRHYKGGKYELLGVARHSETLEPLIIYRPIYEASGLWARPHAMFFGNVEVDGVQRPRFVRIGG